MQCKFYTFTTLGFYVLQSLKGTTAQNIHKTTQQLWNKFSARSSFSFLIENKLVTDMSSQESNSEQHDERKTKDSKKL